MDLDFFFWDFLTWSMQMIKLHSGNEDESDMYSHFIISFITYIYHNSLQKYSHLKQPTEGISVFSQAQLQSPLVMI
jgi:hypothetical protein